MFILITLLFGFFFIGLLLFIIKGNRIEKTISSSTVFFTFFIVSYFIFPAYSDYYQFSRYSLPYLAFSKYYTLLYCALFLSIMIAFYLLINSKISKVSKIELYFLPLKRLYLVGLIIFPLCGMSLIQFLKVISSHGLSAFLANRIVLTSGMGYAQILLYLPLLWSIVIAIEKYVLRVGFFTWKGVLKGALLVIVMSSPLAILGSRSNILFGLIIYFFSVLLFLLKSGQVLIFLNKIKKFLVVVISLVILGAALGDVRQSLMSESGSYTSTEKIPFEDVAKAFSSYENLYWLFSKEEEVEFQYGKTLLSIVVGPFPRSVWPEKPTGGGPIMKNLISPGSYDLLSGEKISSYTTGIPTESYLNFGWLGLLIVPLIMALIVYTHQFFMSRASNSLEIVVAAALLLRMLGFVNAEFYGVFIHIFVILLFYFFCKLFLSVRHK